jgi:hypothetical protein
VSLVDVDGCVVQLGDVADGEPVLAITLRARACGSSTRTADKGRHTVMTLLLRACVLVWVYMGLMLMDNQSSPDCVSAELTNS